MGEDIEESLEVDFHGTTLKISLSLPEDSLEPLFSGASWAGTCVWDAANQLCNYMEREEELKDKLVIELGCGLGLPGLCCHVLGADVILTEQESLIGGLHMNIEANFPEAGDRIKAQELSWGADAGGELLQQLNGRQIDYIICSDCVCEHLYGEAWKLLAETMGTICGPKTQMLISMERRETGGVPDGVDFFLQALREQYGFTVSEVFSQRFEHAGKEFSEEGKAGLVQIFQGTR